MKHKYTPGQDCGCYAYSESECGCGADWTPSEVYELREQVKNLLSKMEGMGYRHSHLRCQIIQAENVTHRYKDRLQSERALADRLADCLNNLWHHHSLTEASYDYIDNTLDAWKEARSE